MTNQAAQTMPELPYELEMLVARLYADAYQAGHDATVEGHFIDLHPNDRDTYWLDLLRENEDVQNYASALSQTAGVVVKWEVRRRFWSGAPWGPWESYETEAERTESFAKFEGSEWLHETRELYAAAPAASGGESAASLSSNPNPVTPSLSSESAASVSERARHGVIRATVRATDEDDVLHVECRFDDGQKYAAIEISGHKCEELASFIVNALEQALTQQRGEEPLGYTALFNAIASATWPATEDVAINVSVAKFHESIGGNVYTTPQPSADAVRDGIRMDWLVSKAVEIRDPLRHGSRAMFHAQTASDEDEPHRTTLREQIDAAMADELESLLSAASGEKGVG